MEKHVHHDLIVAWAGGTKIQLFSPYREAWEDVNNPTWKENMQYRIKPERRDDVVTYARITLSSDPCMDGARRVFHNVKYIFDGETCKLKSVEII